MRKRDRKSGDKVLANGLFNETKLDGEAPSQPIHQVEQAPLAPSPKLIAKKDFVIRQEPYKRVIKAGEDLSDVPEKYHQNLRTEGVL